MSASSILNQSIFICCLLSCFLQAVSAGNEEWEFRLAGGQTQLTGRVEMRPNSTAPWGTICVDEVFKATQYAAIAACNSAGLVGVNQAIMVSTLAGSTSQPIYITNVLCSVTDQFLQNCSTSALYSVGQCIHSEDVTISCTPPPQFWKFRLTNGTSPGNGILMMQPMPSLPWGTVYYYYIVYDYQYQDSRLKQKFFCDEVGFPLNETKDERAITNQAQRLYQRNNYYPYDLPSYYQVYGCSPGTTNVRDCQYNTIGATTWSYSEHLWLDCRPPQSKQELLTEIKIDERWSPLGWRSGMGTLAARKNSTDSWGNIPAVSIFPFSYSVSPYSYNVLTTNQTNTLKLLCAAAGFPNANTPAAMTYPTTYYYTPDYYLYWYTDDISCPLDATSFAVDCLAQIDHQGAYTRSGGPLGVDCYPEVERPSEWEFRLVNGNTNSSGIVNMRPNSTAPWALIGYDGDLGYNLIGWVAVCRSLGFNSSVDDYAAGRPFALRRDFCAYGCSTVYNKWLQAVGGCTLWDKPQYTSIQNCTSRWRLGAFSSNSYDGIVIDCMSHPYDPSQWEFRLVEGTRPGMGKLEWRPWPELDWGLLGNQYQSTLNSLDQLFRALSICRSLGFLNVTNPDFLPVGNVNYTQEVYSYGINCRIDNTYVQNCSQVYPLRTPQVGSQYYTYWIDCYSPNIFKAEWKFENGGTPWRGRLLYRFSNYAPFGTVCNDYFKHNHFSWNAACHSAGYTNVTGARYLAMGPGSGDIYLDDIRCLATNFYLEDCQKADLGVTNCFHGQDAGVDCYPPPDELWRWEFRLTDGSKTTNGRLEMRPTSVSSWGTVCSDIFNHTYSAWMAACRTVGYPNVQRAAWRYNGMGPEIIYLDKIDCRNTTSNETILTNCSGYPIGSYDCTSWDAAGVDCDPEPERPQDWQFTLAGGTAATNGRVMMRPTPSTPWGTVCKRGLTSVLNLTMICLSLGFSATTRPVLRNFGRGTTPMYLDEGSCGQGAHFLNNCTFAPLFSHDCLGADEALALDCYPTMTETLTATITHSNLVNVTPTVNTATRSLEATESALINKTKSLETSRTSSLSFTQVDTKSAAVNNTKTKLPTVTATITLKSPMPEETKTVLVHTLSHEPTASKAKTSTQALQATPSIELGKTLSADLNQTKSLANERTDSAHELTGTVKPGPSGTLNPEQTLSAALVATKTLIPPTTTTTTTTTTTATSTTTPTSTTTETSTTTPTSTTTTPTSTTTTPTSATTTLPSTVTNTTSSLTNATTTIGETNETITTDFETTSTFGNVTTGPTNTTPDVNATTEVPPSNFTEANTTTEEGMTSAGGSTSSANDTAPTLTDNTTNVTVTEISEDGTTEEDDEAPYHPRTVTRTLIPPTGEGTNSNAAVNSGRALGIVSSLFFLVGDGTAVEVQAMAAMMLAAPCASDWDREAMLVLRYFLSPFVDLGSIAVVLTHIGLTAFVAVLHFFVVYVVKQSNHKTGLMDEWRVACAYCFFPAVPMFVGGLLYTGAAVATIEGLVSDDNAAIAIGAALGLPFLLIVPAVTWWVSKKAQVEYVEADLSKFNGATKRLMPKGHWGPSVEHRWILAAHGWVRAMWLKPAALVTPYAVGFLVAVIVTAVTNCRARYALVCLISAICCIAMAVIRPHRALASSILSSVAFGALCLLSGAQLKALVDGEAADSVQSFRLAAMIIMLVAVLLRTAHNALVLWLYRDPVFDLNRLAGEDPNYPRDELDDLDVEKPDIASKYSPRNSAAVSRAASYQPRARDTWLAKTTAAGTYSGEDAVQGGADYDDISKSVKHIVEVDFEDFEEGRPEGLEGDEEIPTYEVPQAPLETAATAVFNSESETAASDAFQNAEKMRRAELIRKTQVNLDDLEDLE